MPLTATIITSAAPLRELAEDWAALLSRSEADTLFMTPAWILTWIETTDDPPELFVVAVRDGDRLVGLAPFYNAVVRTPGRLSFRCLRIVGDQNTSSEYQDIIVDTDYADAAMHEIARCIRSHQFHFTFIWVPYTDVSRGASDRFSQLFRLLGLRYESRTFNYYTAYLPSSRDEFDASLSAKQRNNIRRYKKRLTDGNLELIDMASQASADDTFQTLRELHESRWNSVGESGAFQRRPAFARFLQAYSNTAEGSRMLWAPTLIVSSKAVAIRYGYRYKNVFYEIQTGFLPNYSGSGIVNVDMAIEHGIDDGLQAYDFLAYAGDYKQRFTANPRAGSSFLAATPGLAGRIVFAAGIWPSGRFMTLSGTRNRDASV